MFTDRAKRLRHLAPQHELGPYLAFLSTIVAAQAAAAHTTPASSVPAAKLSMRGQHHMPLFTAEEVQDNPAFAATLAALLAHVDAADFPAPAQAAVTAVRGMSANARDELAVSILAGAYPAEHLAESLFIAAGLQVHLAHLAQTLAADAVSPATESVCPVCGAAPVSSLVVGWTQASKARYCACSLCGTLWNHVRIKCTSCGATGGIIYYSIEEAPGPIGIEACTTCTTYIKHMRQHEDTNIDPLADDVASYTLDLLVGEAGYRRSSINPLFLQP